MKKKSFTIWISVIWVLLSLLTVAGATFAWFTFNPATNVEPSSSTISDGEVALLISARPNADSNPEADFDVVVEEDFDPVGAGGLEFDVHEEFDVGGRGFGVGQADGNGAGFGDDGLEVGGDEAGALVEFAFAGAPAGGDEKAVLPEGELRGAQGVEEADEDEFAGFFLADVVAEEGGLEVGEHVHGGRFEV